MINMNILRPLDLLLFELGEISWSFCQYQTDNSLLIVEINNLLMSFNYKNIMYADIYPSYLI